MKFCGIAFQLSYLFNVYLFLYTIPLSSGKNMSKHADCGLNITDELRDNIKEVWCNSENYTALCQGYHEIRLCFGEVIRAEFLSIKNDTRLYEYGKRELGDMLTTINCSIRTVSRDPDNMAFGVRKIHWVLIVVFFMGCVMLVRIICYTFLFDDEDILTDSKDKNVSVKTETAPAPSGIQNDFKNF